MTAFDTAWGIVKMPIVQGSVHRTNDSDEHVKRYGALFDDPETGERMNMKATLYPEQHIGAKIEAPVDDTYKFHPRASGHFRTYPRWGGTSEKPKFEGTGIGTDDEYQRRGYATGIYDLVAYILDRQGADLVPSTDQTAPGKALWESVLSNLEDDEEKRWRIRGDLG